MFAVAVATAVVAGTSTLESPSVVFDSAGLKSVTLTSCRDHLCDETTQVIQVLDPRPAILSSLVVSSPGLEVGHLVALRGSGIGKPPLTFAWEILSGTDVVAEVAGPNGVWDSAGFPSGAYAARLRVSNSAGFEVGDPISLALGENRPLSFYTIVPCRLFDSRDLSNPVRHGELRRVAVADRCGLPADVRTIVANVTVTAATARGSVTSLPGNYPLLDVPVTHFGYNQTRANMAILMLATDGTGEIVLTANVPPAGWVDVILDVSGYWAPLATSPGH